jgi:16S rRNA U516 pseudouridylate synthase RsuA-like enzyme
MSFRPVVVALHKPVGYVVSKDDKHNDTIYNFLPPSWKEDFYYV